jgi:hypothetical protein
MKAALARLASGLAVAMLATVVAAGSPEPFAALGLVRLEGRLRAPDFTLADLDGRPVGVATTPHAATLLMFWNTW